VEQEVFAFMTTEPNELTKSINHERMPVLLTDPADFETWLSGSADEAFKLARSYAADIVSAPGTEQGLRAREVRARSVQAGGLTRGSPVTIRLLADGPLEVGYGRR
jgi:putative SOS response-associated peptidase YedK